MSATTTSRDFDCCVEGHEAPLTRVRHAGETADQLQARRAGSTLVARHGFRRFVDVSGEGTSRGVHLGDEVTLVSVTNAGARGIEFQVRDSAGVLFSSVAEDAFGVRA